MLILIFNIILIWENEAKLVMPNDFEMIKLVRANLVAQAIFFRNISKLFRTIACGISSFIQYSQDVDANGKPVSFSGPLDFVASKAEESGRTLVLVISTYRRHINNI
jgi:hypothetical protein